MANWVSVGTDSITIAYSCDGINWSVVPNSTTIFNVGDGVVWNGTKWVAVGQGPYTIASSSDGINWTGLLNSTSIFSMYGSAIAWNGTRFVAVGEGLNTIAYSDDGVTWTGVTNSYSIFTLFGKYIFWNQTNSRWIATGAGTTNSIAYSDDNGVTWTGLGISIFTTGIGITLSGTRLLAVGNGNYTIAYSDNNGTSWTGVINSYNIFTTTGVGIFSNNTRIIAVGLGTNTIAYSDNNGNTWTGLGTSVFTNGGYNIIWNSALSRWVAVGWGTNSIAYSNDNGNTWTGLGTNTFNFSGQGIFSNNSAYTLPTAPTNLVATNLVSNTSSNGSIVLTWNPSTQDPPQTISYYVIEYKICEFGGWITYPTTILSPTTSATLSNIGTSSNIANNVPYLFRVYAVNSCGAQSDRSNVDGATSYNNNAPTRLWSRFNFNCSGNITSIDNLNQNMLRKGQVLQYPVVGTLQFSRATLWSMASKNLLTRKKAWASQSQEYTYPNTTNINNQPDVGLRQTPTSLVCWRQPPAVICNSSSASGVPGNPTTLCISKNAPFDNFRRPITYSSGGTKFPVFFSK